MENKENLLYQEKDDLSVKDIINNIKALFNFFKLQFWKLFILGLIGGGIGFYFAFRSTPIYAAKVKFLIKESGGSSALMSSLGSLGSLIGGAGGTASPLDRTLAIMGSEKIVGSALLKKIIVNNKPDLAINHLIRVYELDVKWEKDSLLRGIFFLENQTVLENFDFAHRKAYREILNLLVGEKSTIIVKSFDKKSGVFEQVVNISNEEFSINFNNSLYKELEQFLYEQSLTSSSKNVEILNNKIDSIKSALSVIQNSLARNSDRTLGLLMQEDKVDQKKLMMKEQMLTIMYGEAQKNLETFKFMNESINPGLELLQTPFTPIKPIKKSKIIFFLVGFLMSGFVGFGFLLIKKWVNDLL